MQIFSLFLSHQRNPPKNKPQIFYFKANIIEEEELQLKPKLKIKKKR